MGVVPEGNNLNWQANFQRRIQKANKHLVVYVGDCIACIGKQGIFQLVDIPKDTIDKGPVCAKFMLFHCELHESYKGNVG